MGKSLPSGFVQVSLHCVSLCHWKHMVQGAGTSVGRLGWKGRGSCSSGIVRTGWECEVLWAYHVIKGSRCGRDPNGELWWVPLVWHTIQGLFQNANVLPKVPNLQDRNENSSFLYLAHMALHDPVSAYVSFPVASGHTTCWSRSLPSRLCSPTRDVCIFFKKQFLQD